MALPLPNVVFNVADRGGEYMTKLNALAVAVDQAVQGVNGNAGLAATFDEYIQIIIPGYIGTWDELAGSASIGDVVYHAGSSALWRAVTAIADITASEPSGGNADWELEGDRYATLAQGAKADTAVQPGDGGLLGAAIDLGGANASAAGIGQIMYFAGTHAQALSRGLPDLEINGATLVHWIIFTYGTSTRSVQKVTQCLAADGAQGFEFKRVKVGATWAAWGEVGSGGGDDGVVTTHDFGIAAGSTPLNSWTELEPDELQPGPHYEITFDLDCSTSNYWEGWTNNHPTSDTFNYDYDNRLIFDITNIPDASGGKFIGFIEWRAMQRYAGFGQTTPEFQVPAGWSVEWAGGGSAPALGTGNNNFRVIQFSAYRGVNKVVLSLAAVV